MHFSAAQYDERGLAVASTISPADRARLVDLLVKTRGGAKASLHERRSLAEWIHLHGA